MLFSGDVRTDQRSYVKTICTFLQIKHEQWDFSVMLLRKCSEKRSEMREELFSRIYFFTHRTSRCKRHFMHSKIINYVKEMSFKVNANARYSGTPLMRPPLGHKILVVITR